MFLCFLAAPVTSSCTECCNGSTCAQAYFEANGICCGKQGGGSACCPTSSICRPEGSSWFCGGSNRAYVEEEAARPFAWFYILLVTLLPFLCLASCVGALVRLIMNRSRKRDPAPTAQPPPPPYSSNAPSTPPTTYAYPAGTTGYAYPPSAGYPQYPQSNYNQQRSGYGAAGLAGAGALGFLGGAALGSAMADGGHYGGGDFGGDGGFAPDVDFAAGV